MPPMLRAYAGCRRFIAATLPTEDASLISLPYLLELYWIIRRSLFYQAAACPPNLMPRRLAAMPISLRPRLPMLAGGRYYRQLAL